MVDVSADDYNRLPSCLNYVRSALNVNANCSFGPAQQVNLNGFFFHLVRNLKIRNIIPFMQKKKNFFPID